VYSCRNRLNVSNG